MNHQQSLKRFTAYGSDWAFAKMFNQRCGSLLPTGIAALWLLLGLYAALYKTNWWAHAHRLGQGLPIVTLALLCSGLAAWCTTPLPQLPTINSERVSHACNGSMEKLHAGLLIAMFASIPIHERLSWVMLMAIWMLLAIRCRQVPWHGLGDCGPLKWLVVGFCWQWAAGLLLANLWAGGGWPATTELIRNLMPLAMLVGVLASSLGLPMAVSVRAIYAFVVVLTAAALFGVLCYGLDVRPWEAWVRPHVYMSIMGQIPGSTHTVAGGFFYHRLMMAHVCLAAFAGFLARRFSDVRIGKQQLRLEWGFGLLLIVTILLCYTRAASLAMWCMLGVAVVAGNQPWWRKGWQAMLLASVLTGLALGLPQVATRVSSVAAADVLNDRQIIWQTGIDLLSGSKWGIGLGCYPLRIGSYYQRLGESELPRTYAHNLSLSVWVECGVLGLMGFWLVYSTLFHFVWQACWQTWHTPQVLWVPLTMLLMLLAAWVVGMTHDFFYHPPVAYAFWGLWALLLRMLVPPRPTCIAVG